MRSHSRTDNSVEIYGEKFLKTPQFEICVATSWHADEIPRGDLSGQRSLPSVFRSISTRQAALAYWHYPRGKPPSGRAARGSVDPRKMACRPAVRGSHRNRFKAVDWR